MPDIKNGSPRERILAVADRLFYEQGYRATGLAQLIREAKVAKASFYDHFPTKEALAVAYLQQRHDLWVQRFEAAVTSARTPKTRFIAAFDLLSDWLTEVAFRGCAFVNLSAEFPDGCKVRDEIVAHKTWLRSRFIELAHDCGLSTTKARVLGGQAFLLFEGAISQCEVMRRVDPVREALTAARDLTHQYL